MADKLDIVHVVDSGTITNPATFDFTVPVGQQWRLGALSVAWTSSATVGERLLSVQILDGAAAVVFKTVNAVVHAESLLRFYGYGVGVALGAAFVGGALDLPLPPMALEPGWEVRVADDADIDAVGDSFRAILSPIVTPDRSI